MQNRLVTYLYQHGYHVTHSWAYYSTIINLLASVDHTGSPKALTTHRGTIATIQ